MTILGGCRLVVTLLGSKLITLGAGLACFEMRPAETGEKYDRGGNPPRGTAALRRHDRFVAAFEAGGLSTAPNR